MSSSNTVMVQYVSIAEDHVFSLLLMNYHAFTKQPLISPHIYKVPVTLLSKLLFVGIMNNVKQEIRQVLTRICRTVKICLSRDKSE